MKTPIFKRVIQAVTPKQPKEETQEQIKETKTCPFCEKNIECTVYYYLDINGIKCEDCSTILYFKKNVILYYTIIISSKPDSELDLDSNLYLLHCEIGPRISALYCNKELIQKNIPDIFTPEEAKRKLKTLLVFS